MRVVALEAHVAVIRFCGRMVQSKRIGIAGELQSLRSRDIPCVVAVDRLVAGIDEAVVGCRIVTLIIGNTLVLCRPTDFCVKQILDRRLFPSSGFCIS